ncbi:MAG: hypothetical protein H6Q26_527 [Bacteroidetes bacterium]|nr:hypothetical protein [Bacteroidota bacterium]
MVLFTDSVINERKRSRVASYIHIKYFYFIGFWLILHNYISLNLHIIKEA